MAEKKRRAYAMSADARAARKRGAEATRAAAEARGGKKEFVTLRVEPDAREMMRAFVADPANGCATFSDAIRTRFGN